MLSRGSAIAAFCVVALLGFAGSGLDFIPGRVLLHMAWPVSCFAVALVTVLALPRFIGPYEPLADLPRWSHPLLLFAMIAILGGLLWNLCVLTVPWAWTRVMGVQHDEEVEAQVAHKTGKGCDRLEIEGLLFGICIPPATYRAYRETRVRVRLEGRRSPLGYAITDARVLNTVD